MPVRSVFLFSDRFFFSSLCECCGVKSTCVTVVSRYLQKVTGRHLPKSRYYLLLHTMLLLFSKTTVCPHFRFQVGVIMEVKCS